MATTIETLKSFGDPTLEPTIDDRRRWIAFLRSAAFAVDRQGTPTERRQSLRQMAFDDEDELVAASVREHARWAGPPRLHMIEERGARRTSEGMVLEGHLRDIRHLALLDDLIVSGDADGTVRIWSTTTGEPTASIELPSLRGLLAAGSGGCVARRRIRPLPELQEGPDRSYCPRWAQSGELGNDRPRERATGHRLLRRRATHGRPQGRARHHLAGARTPHSLDLSGRRQPGGHRRLRRARLTVRPHRTPGPAASPSRAAHTGHRQRRLAALHG